MASIEYGVHTNGQVIVWGLVTQEGSTARLACMMKLHDHSSSLLSLQMITPLACCLCSTSGSLSFCAIAGLLAPR